MRHCMASDLMAPLGNGLKLGMVHVRLPGQHVPIRRFSDKPGDGKNGRLDSVGIEGRQGVDKKTFKTVVEGNDQRRKGRRGPVRPRFFQGARFDSPLLDSADQLTEFIGRKMGQMGILA